MRGVLRSPSRERCAGDVCAAVEMSVVLVKMSNGCTETAPTCRVPEYRASSSCELVLELVTLVRMEVARR